MIHDHKYPNDQRIQPSCKIRSGMSKHRRRWMINTGNGHAWCADLGAYGPSAKVSKKYLNSQVRSIPIDDTDTIENGNYRKLSNRKITGHCFD